MTPRPVVLAGLLLVLAVLCPASQLSTALEGVGAGAASVPSAPQPVARAPQSLEPRGNGLRLTHPQRRVDFSPDEVRVKGRRGGPLWIWRLTAVLAPSGEPLVEPVSTRPVVAGPDLVRYDRGFVLEEYLITEDHLEQRFLLLQPPAPGRGDLVVTGEIRSAAAFAATPEGGRWQSERGEVTLGRARVVDRNGRELPSRFEVDATGTRWSVAGAVLAAASYPVTLDPEIGTNDFRVSDMGGSGDPDFDAIAPAVAYNSRDDEYLVVWSGDDDTGLLLDDEFEIWGQIVSATGGGVGTNDFRISDAAGTGNTAASATQPDVAYDSYSNRYLVVWSADDPDGGSAYQEFEIYGQLLDSNGSELFSNDFRISHQGPDGDADFDARSPAVAYLGNANVFAVVWEGDGEAFVATGDDDFAIQGRLLFDEGSLLGNAQLVSVRWGFENPNGDDTKPDIAWDAGAGQWVVAYVSDRFDCPDNEFEIWAVSLDIVDLSERREYSRVSDMGGWCNGSGHDARRPRVAYNSTHQEILFAWTGDDDVGALVDNEYEVFVQRSDSNLGGLGFNDYRISDIGGLGLTARGTMEDISLVYQPTGDEYQVCWAADDDVDGILDQEFEIFCQRFTHDLVGLGPNDERVSDAGGLGVPFWQTLTPAVAANRRNGQYLVVWSGADDVDAMVTLEYEIFGQRLLSRGIFGDGFENGGTSAWSVGDP